MKKEREIEINKDINTANDEPTLLWIIGKCCSAEDGVSFYKFTGTKTETKQKIVDMVLHDKENNIDEYDYGSESIDDITEYLDYQLEGTGVYSDYHIDYSAEPLERITSLNPEDDKTKRRRRVDALVKALGLPDETERKIERDIEIIIDKEEHADGNEL